jgi:hypothetical protein
MLHFERGSIEYSSVRPSRNRYIEAHPTIAALSATIIARGNGNQDLNLLTCTEFWWRKDYRDIPPLFFLGDTLLQSETDQTGLDIKNK